MTDGECRNDTAVEPERATTELGVDGGEFGNVAAQDKMWLGRCPESCGICLTQSPEGVLRCLPGPRSSILGRLWTSILVLPA